MTPEYRLGNRAGVGKTKNSRRPGQKTRTNRVPAQTIVLLEERVLILEGKLSVRDHDITRLERQVETLTQKIERIMRAEKAVSALGTFLEAVLSLQAER